MDTCLNGCQYAKDVGVDNAACANGCVYAESEQAERLRALTDQTDDLISRTKSTRGMGDGVPVTGEMAIDSGAVWKINHDVLHPLGLTLGVYSDGSVRLMESSDGDMEFDPTYGAAAKQKWDAFERSRQSRQDDLRRQAGAS